VKAGRLVHSFFHFISYQWRKEEVDILFYHPIHFNRSAEGENPFFAPLYRICEDHGITYRTFIEPELFKKESGKPQEDAAPFDFVLLCVLIARKVLPLGVFDSFEAREKFIGKLLRPLLFRRFHFRHFVVLSNSLLSFFRGVAPEAKLFDYQHGLIFSNHSGYLTPEGTPAPHIFASKTHLLLYGKGFKKVLTTHDKTGYYETHTHVLGIGMPANEPPAPHEKNRILFTLQFTGSGEYPEKQRTWLRTILDFFRRNKELFARRGLEVLFKHHPRYDGTIDVSELEKLPFARFVDGTMEEALQGTFLHMTLFSTSIFDVSAYGIPTLLLRGEESLAPVYGEDFAYPLGSCDAAGAAGAIETYLDDPQAYNKACRDILAWYRGIYSPLDENAFVKLFSHKDKR